MEPKTAIGVSKNVVFNFDLDDLCRLHPLSPEEAPRTIRWGVNRIYAHAYFQLSDIYIRFAKKKIDHLYFTFASSSLKDKMHFMCLTRSFTSARGRMGNFTPLDPRKIEFNG